MLLPLKRFIRERVFPFTSWLPRYYVLCQWLDQLPASKILDLCCGEGYISLKLAENGHQVTGLDLNLEDLQKAREKKSRSKYQQNIEFLSGNILQLPFNDRKFDVVILLDALQEIKQDKEALAEIARVIKPQGKLLITTPWRYPCQADLYQGQKTLRRIIPGFMRRVHIANGRKWLEMTNEQVMQAHQEQHQYSVVDLEEKAKPYFQLAGFRYFLQKYGALATDITYGIKGLWTLRFIFFWVAVRLDWYHSGNRPGYSFIAEFVKR